MKQLKITRQFTSKGLQSFLSEAAKYPPLKPEEEATATPEQLVKHNMLFVVSVAKQYTSESEQLKDYVSEGLIGLIRASQNFDSTRGFKFISHAVFWIRAAIIDYIRRKETVKIPEYQERINRKIRDNIDEFTEDELKEKFGIKDYYMKQYHNRPRLESIDDSFDFHEGDFKKQYASTENTAEAFEKKSFRKDIRNLLAQLDYKGQEVLRLHYLVDFPLSFAAIGEQLRMTQERVRQIHNESLQKLRHKSAARGLLTL